MSAWGHCTRCGAEGGGINDDLRGDDAVCFLCRRKMHPRMCAECSATGTHECTVCGNLYCGPNGCASESEGQHHPTSLVEVARR